MERKLKREYQWIKEWFNKTEERIPQKLDWLNTTALYLKKKKKVKKYQITDLL